MFVVRVLDTCEFSPGPKVVREAVSGTTCSESAQMRDMQGQSQSLFRDYKCQAFNVFPETSV